MKYQSEHGFTHPVLSPESDHYPNGQFSTALRKPEDTDGGIRIIVDFTVQEPTLEQLISDGKARCEAMLYCRATLHQQTLQAEARNTRIDATVSPEMLRDAIELHPLIVATETITLNTNTADPFYHGTNPTVLEGEPLATDRGWHFNLDVDSLPLGSIFQFMPEPETTGPMQIEIDPHLPYINIRVNSEQFKEMNITRQQGLTVPSVFSAALVRAIQRVQKIEPDETPIVPGWVDTIRKQADKHGIDLEGDDPFVAAQTLLGDPFASLTKFQMQSIEEQPE
jgi:hypothetical protein